MFFASCAAVGGYINDKPVTKKTLGSPETHTLFFGHSTVKPGMFGGSDTRVFAQINPEKSAFFCIPFYMTHFGKNSPGVFCIPPVEQGSELRLIQSTYVYSVGNGFGGGTVFTYVYNTLLGIQESYLQFKAEKPGLQYVGSYMRQNDGYVPEETGTELNALLEMQAFFKGTEWQAVIEQRIKELKK